MCLKVKEGPKRPENYISNGDYDTVVAGETRRNPRRPRSSLPLRAATTP